MAVLSLTNFHHFGFLWKVCSIICLICSISFSLRSFKCPLTFTISVFLKFLVDILHRVVLNFSNLIYASLHLLMLTYWCLPSMGTYHLKISLKTPLKQHYVLTTRLTTSYRGGGSWFWSKYITLLVPVALGYPELKSSNVLNFWYSSSLTVCTSDVLLMTFLLTRSDRARATPCTASNSCAVNAADMGVWMNRDAIT